MPLKLFALGAALLLPLALARSGCSSAPDAGMPAADETPTGLTAGSQAQGTSAGSGDGLVSVLPSASRFAVGQELTLVVANGSTDVVYVEDMKTDCSIVTLEVASGEVWETVWGCGMERLPRIVTIEPGGSASVTIRPTSTHFLEGPLPAGTYRARFSYRLAPEPEGDEPEVAFSDEFQIGS